MENCPETCASSFYFNFEAQKLLAHLNRKFEAQQDQNGAAQKKSIHFGSGVVCVFAVSIWIQTKQ